MKRIEPTGVIFAGICDIQTDRCVARQTAPITAVWAHPGRTQVNVCRECLEEMVRKGEWKIEGARIRQRADVVAYNSAGKVTLIVEAKFPSNKHSSDRQAIQVRQNLIAHRGIPAVPYFMVAFPDYFYLWTQSDMNDDSEDRPADIKIDAKSIIDRYAQVIGVNLDEITPLDFERLVYLWLKDISSEAGDTLEYRSFIGTDFIRALSKGSIALEVAI